MEAHKERSHAILSASGAERWLNCPPSARLEEEFPQTTSEYAREGTLAHELAEIYLRAKVGDAKLADINKELKRIKASELYSDEMKPEVEKYTDIVLENYYEAKKLTPSAVLELEQKVDLTAYIPEGFGTCDAIIIADGLLDVYDLKYGKGVRVSAEGNSQLMLYALGAYYKYSIMYDIQRVRVNIVQPRIDNYSSWELTAKHLVDWGETIVRPLAELADKGEGKFTPGDWCRWCRASARCKALAEYGLSVARHEFKEPNLLSDEELLEVYAKQPFIQDWINRVSEYMLSEALAGKAWEGLKLVEGRSIRKWKNEGEVMQALIEAGYTEAQILKMNLLGIGEIEKLLKKDKRLELIQGLTIKPQGKPTLVELSDKRPALGIEQAKQDFSN